MNIELIKNIKHRANEIQNEIIEIRRYLHQHPELSFKEFNTADFIEKTLKDYGITNIYRMVETGVVAEINGKNPTKKVLALRADIDALPIQEENNTSYTSKNSGIMHACGHDIHTASLLGVSKLLNENKHLFEGTIKLIFQPGEEKLPGGASLMIKEGVLENPTPSVIIGQHVFPELDAGKVGFRSGMYMASTDELYLTVKGKGGHAALPHKYNNPILIASKILLEVDKEFMKDKAKLKIPTVVAFGKMIANGATNIIPNEVHIEGTFRTMNEEWREKAHSIMNEIAQKVCKEMEGECNFRIEKGYPFLVNDTDLTNRLKEISIEFLGKENVIDLEMRMTAEDFAYYSQVKPSCFYRLGVGASSGLHTSTFEANENSLSTSVGLMTYIAITELNNI
ncbi:MAG: amidohydrolase [Flavobacteriales bacterium]|nr:amidohydrolase [Flavobacteriales bacterium]